MGVGGQRYVPAALPPRTRLYPFYRRLGGFQGRSGKARKISPPTGIRSPDLSARSESILIGSKWNKDVTLCDWVLLCALKNGSGLKTPRVTQDITFWTAWIFSRIAARSWNIASTMNAIIQNRSIKDKCMYRNGWENSFFWSKFVWV